MTQSSRVTPLVHGLGLEVSVCPCSAGWRVCQPGRRTSPVAGHGVHDEGHPLEDLRNVLDAASVLGAAVFIHVQHHLHTALVLCCWPDQRTDTLLQHRELRAPPAEPCRSGVPLRPACSPTWKAGSSSRRSMWSSISGSTLPFMLLSLTSTMNPTRTCRRLHCGIPTLAGSRHSSQPCTQLRRAQAVGRPPRQAASWPSNIPVGAGACARTPCASQRRQPWPAAPCQVPNTCRLQG